MPVRSSWARLLRRPGRARGGLLRTGRHPAQRARHHRRRDGRRGAPEGCAGDAPSPTAPVTFVAEGRAWATTPDGLRLWCLFEVRRPGPFLWGPAATGWCWTGWRSAGSAPRCGGRPAGSTPCRWPGWAPTGTRSPSSCRAASTWPRPSSARSTCASSPRSGRLHLPGGGRPPVRGGAGLRAPARGRLEIWMASNAGSGAVRLVGPTRARLGPLAFSAGGKALYYGARQPDGSRRLEVFSLAEGRRLAPAWTGERDVLAVVSRRDPAATQIAVDTGSGCDDRRADLSGLDGGRAGRCCRRRPADRRRRLGQHPPGAGGRGRLRRAVRPVAGGRERRRAEAGGPRDRPGGAALARPPPRPAPRTWPRHGRG